MTTANGTASQSSADLRQELRSLRLANRIHAEKAQARLLEAFYPYPSTTGGWGEFVDPMDRYRDGDRLVTPMGLPAQQTGAAWPLIQSEQDLRTAQEAANLVAELNPFAVGALEGLTSFMVGEGMTCRAASKPEDKGLAALVQEFVDDWYERQVYSELQAELLWRSRVDGEYFLRRHDCDGYLDLRVVEPWQVTENGMPPGPGRSFGKQHLVNDDGTEDAQTTTDYWVRYDQRDAGAWVSVDEIQHVKINVRRNVKRGLPDFVPTQDAFEGVRKLLRNMREGAAIQSAIAGVREHQASEEKAGGFQDRIRAQYQHTNPATGRTQKYQKYEPGMILDVGGGMAYKPPPWVGTGTPGFVAVAQSVLRMIGTRWQFPEYMVSGSAENANYASTLVSGAPFIRFAKRWQAFYKRRFLEPIKAAVRLAGAVGRLPREALTQVWLVMEAPLPEIANRLEDAQVADYDLRNGVLSVQTRRQQIGLDNEQERLNLKEEPYTGGAMPGGLGLPTPAADPISGADVVTQAQDASPTDALRASVGGSQAIAALQASVYKGELPREAAIANAQIVFGFSPEQADKLFPQTAPVKLTPEPSAPMPVVAEGLRQLLECGGKGGRPGPCPTGGESGGSAVAKKPAARSMDLKLSRVAGRDLRDMMDEVPAMDPKRIPPIIVTKLPDGTPDIVDGFHRTAGVLKWAEKNGIDPRKVKLPIVYVNPKAKKLIGAAADPGHPKHRRAISVIYRQAGISEGLVHEAIMLEQKFHLAASITEAMTARYRTLESEHGADVARSILRAVAGILGAPQHDA